MYIYDPKLSGSRSRPGERLITSRTQRDRYYPDRAVGEFLARGGVNREYVWAHKGLGQTPTALSSKFLWPSKFPVETLKFQNGTFSTKLQSAFGRAINAALNNAAFSHLPDVRTVPIAIVALDDGSHPVAGQHEFEMFFSGSLLKVAAMYAAFQLRVAVNDLAATLNAAVVDTPAKLFQKISNTFDKQIDESVPRIRFARGVTPAMRVPKYRTVFQAVRAGSTWRLKFNDTGPDSFAIHLHKMIVGSHNDSARFCVRALGYSWINGVLQSAGFFRESKPPTGIWLAADYDEKGGWPVVVIPSVNDDLVKQVTTSIDMAKLFVLLHDKKLVKNTVHFATGLSGNDEMLKLLELAVDHPHAKSLLKTVSHSFTVEQSKIGVGELKKAPQGGKGSCRIADHGCVLSEASILLHPPSGRRFVTVWQNVLWDAPLVGVRRVAAVIQKTMDDYKP
jgi:hypothetical protein